MGEVIHRLGIEATHVVFGHTHRRGPLDGEYAWRTGTGTGLLNSGSWTYLSGLIGSATAEESPYWPGTVVEVDAERPPRARLLLSSLARGELEEACTRLGR
jgi:hypothetical protein